MRLIDADKLPLNDIDSANHGSNYIQIAETVKAIPIPNNATNGDMLMAMFPSLEVNTIGNTVFTNMDNGVWYNLDWWDTPYQVEVEE